MYDLLKNVVLILLSGSIISSAIECEVRAENTVLIKGEIRDADSGKLIPARVYLSSGEKWFFLESSASQGTAVVYDKQRGASIEKHTTLSAHPFEVQLPIGEYNLTVEHGKDYIPFSRTFLVGEEPVEIKVYLNRWIDTADLGWYSGDTHTHRKLKDLPNVILAEDLNVALPLTGWVRDAFESPAKTYKLETGRVEDELITVDSTHVIYPLNTEWEIFSVKGQRHTLGAVFALGQKKPSKLGVPPVLPLAKEAREQGAILDLDKHNWPWSISIIPIMNVDLFELSNNHVWRTEFSFASWNTVYSPDYMNLDRDEKGLTEQGWLDFGFNTYYALLNSGFHMRPSAGTASGVHPVPLGFGRVYVELPGGFDYEKWMQGLNAGRSFVSTGPLLFVKANGKPAGHRFSGVTDICHLTGSAESVVPLSRIEIIHNGEIVEVIEPQNQKKAQGGYRSTIDIEVPLEGSSWVAVRCYEKRDDQRVRFAHTSPFHFQIPGKPLRPRKIESAYLLSRVEEELSRSRKLLPEAAVQELEQAVQIFRKIHETSR